LPSLDPRELSLKWGDGAPKSAIVQLRGALIEALRRREEVRRLWAG